MTLKITEGITPSQIKDLINYSNNDKLILETTRDASRFKDQDAFNVWSKKNRKIYTLSNENGKLMGIVWFGKELIPIGDEKFGITFAIRLYDNARGKGNAKPFLEESFKKYRETNDYKENPAKGFWLETKSENIPAVAAYKRFGFKEIEFKNDSGRILMVLEG